MKDDDKEPIYAFDKNEYRVEINQDKKKMKTKKEEREDEKRICSVCLSIKTRKEINEDCENGGMGMCMCQWTCDNRVYYPYEDLKTCRKHLLHQIDVAKKQLEQFDNRVEMK